MNKCKHRHCLECGDMCPICGDDERKYNAGVVDYCYATKSLPSGAWMKQKKRVHKSGDFKNGCSNCGKSPGDMTEMERIRFFHGGKCCD